MESELPSCNHAEATGEEEEEYIDMEVTFSPPQTREFEFQTSSISTPSLADDLFYNGKLLPLHLPPRLQMLQNLLQTTINPPPQAPPPPPPYTTPTIITKNPDQYSPEPSSSSTELISFIDDQPLKFWSKKLKLMKQSPLCQKLIASRTYFKSLFSTKNGFSDVLNVTIKKNPFEDDHGGFGIPSQRRSFSGAIIKRNSNYPTKCLYSSSSSTSSSSSSSDSSNELQLLKRSSSASSEIEGSIEAAIAHFRIVNDQHLKNIIRTHTDKSRSARHPCCRVVFLIPKASP